MSIRFCCWQLTATNVRVCVFGLLRRQTIILSMPVKAIISSPRQIPTSKTEHSFCLIYTWIGVEKGENVYWNFTSRSISRLLSSSVDPMQINKRNDLLTALPVTSPSTGKYYTICLLIVIHSSISFRPLLNNFLLSWWIGNMYVVTLLLHVKPELN